MDLSGSKRGAIAAMIAYNEPLTADQFKALRKKPKRHKYGAIADSRDGIKFPSKIEARYYDKLKNLQHVGEVAFFLRQVAFDLPGKVRYICDYQVFWTSGDVTFVDVKGKDTPLSILKRKQVEDLYPVEIEVITKV